MAAQSLWAKKMSVIFAAAEEAVNQIPDVPDIWNHQRKKLKLKVS